MADLPYRIVIGLEVHVQLLTQTKLFCGCSTQFGLPPNSATCPVCIGMPGVLPVMNRRAFDLALRGRPGAQLPDRRLHQVGPQELLLSRSAEELSDQPVRPAVQPRRLAGDRDGRRRRSGSASSAPTSKRTPARCCTTRRAAASDSLVDLNRAGTPLLEIVSQPDLTSPEEAKAYLEEIRLLLREIGVSDCEMQEGSLRCDANVNIHVPAARTAQASSATPIVEVKNLNSFRAVERAMKYEAERQFTTSEVTGSDALGRVGPDGRRCSRSATQVGRSARCQGDGRLGRGRGVPWCSAARKRRPTTAISRSRTWCRSSWTRPGWSACRAEMGELPAAQRDAAGEAVRPVRLRRRRADAAGAGDGRLFRGRGAGAAATPRRRATGSRTRCWRR